MKTLQNRIDKLTESIELGFLSRYEALFQLRQLRSEVSEKFEEGSDNFMTLINSLIDAHNLATSL